MGQATVTEPLPELPAGVYRHYKGHQYLVLGYARDSDSADGRIVVVYIGLELTGDPGPIRMHVRTVEDFLADVDPDTGEEVTDLLPYTRWRNRVARFVYLGPSADLPQKKEIAL
jgi:hypothetical protein